MFPQVFNVIKFNTWTAVFVLVINSISALTFCFTDQFIIMGSIALGNYFQLFNERIKTHKGQVYITFYPIVLLYINALFVIVLITYLKEENT